jgi:S-adenosylmethionine decarboxylase
MDKNIRALGKHFVVEMIGCNQWPISDYSRVQDILLESAKIAKANIILYDFKPVKQGKSTGVSGGIVISESHFLTHTWPEQGYAAVDIYTCGETMNEEAAIDYIRESFKVSPDNMKLSKLERGLLEEGSKGSGCLVTQEYNPDFKPGKKDIANRHYIIDLYNCEEDKISKVETAAPALLKAARQADSKIFRKGNLIISKGHNFAPSGMSALVVAPGADITIHTWPDHGYAAVDLFISYDSRKGENAIKSLQDAFGSEKVIARELLRGNYRL